MLVDKTIFMKKEVSLMSTSMADISAENQQYASSYYRILNKPVHEQDFFKINMHYLLSVPIIELCSKNHFVNTWM